MDGGKSPSLDGYNSVFFKRNWDIIGKEVSDGVLEFFRNKKMLKQWNVTVLNLIPKVSIPEKNSRFPSYFMLQYNLQNYFKNPFSKTQISDFKSNRIRTVCIYTRTFYFS